MTGYTVEQAQRDLEWLTLVGAVRRHERHAGGESAFVVVTADRREHVLAADEVRALRLGVLVGWRLPRAVGVIG